ncbi:serine hydrolase [Brachybacterium sp. AOP24-D1-21]|uniref:serine hydrolase n=1 Tax=Brachybacterium sp. AOP24-D1-21 TaxID=3457711 RepID=UPI0040333953
MPVLDDHAQESAPGDRFVDNNAGYVLLALLAQRLAGETFRHLVRTRVVESAGMTESGHPRGDEPGRDVAQGYLHEEGLRTNVLPRLLAWPGFRSADPRGLRRRHLRPRLARPGHRHHRLGPRQQLRRGVAGARRGPRGVRARSASVRQSGHFAVCRRESRPRARLY